MVRAILVRARQTGIGRAVIVFPGRDLSSGFQAAALHPSLCVDETGPLGA